MSECQQKGKLLNSGASKKCSICYNNLPLNKFSKHSRARDGLQNSCKECSSSYGKSWESDPNNRRRRKLRQKYDMTLEEYNQMLHDQNYSCAICGSKETRNSKYEFLPVDHCHKTGKVRGLLCDFCNVGLGRFEDDVERLQNAIKYLSTFYTK